MQLNRNYHALILLFPLNNSYLSSSNSFVFSSKMIRKLLFSEVNYSNIVS